MAEATHARDECDLRCAGLTQAQARIKFSGLGLGNRKKRLNLYTIGMQVTDTLFWPFLGALVWVDSCLIWQTAVTGWIGFAGFIGAGAIAVRAPKTYKAGITVNMRVSVLEGTFFASKDVPAGLSKDELGSHRAVAKSYFYSMKPMEMEALHLARLPFD